LEIISRISRMIPRRTVAAGRGLAAWPGFCGHGRGRLAHRHIPAPDAPEERHSRKRHGGEPFDRKLAALHHHEGRGQGADGRPGIAADLEQRLGEAGRIPAARRAIREASGWKIDEPRPIRATGKKTGRSSSARASSTSPIPVEAMPAAMA
jgi:hypothetical protein